MKRASCDERKDPVARMVRDLTAEEMTDWLIECHGLARERRPIVVSNLKEQYKWHRLHGRLDRSNLLRNLAKLLLMWRSPKLL